MHSYSVKRFLYSISNVSSVQKLSDHARNGLMTEATKTLMTSLKESQESTAEMRNTVHGKQPVAKRKQPLDRSSLLISARELETLKSETTSSQTHHPYWEA